MTELDDIPMIYENDAPYPLRFGPQLRSARAYKNRSMGDVARLLGVSAVRVSDVELERGAPFDDLDIGKIASFLGVDPAPLWALAAIARVAWEKRTTPAPPKHEPPMISNAAAQTLLHVFGLLARAELLLPSPRICTFEITGRPAPHPKVKVTWVFKPDVYLSLIIHEAGEMTWETRGWDHASWPGVRTTAPELVQELERMRKAMPS